MNVDKLLIDMIKATDNLCLFLENENALLLTPNPKIDDGHLKKKDFLARDYEGHVRELNEYKIEAKDADKDLRDKAKISGDKLKDIVALNVIRIRARYEANMMLIDSYSRAVNEVNSSDLTYVSSGKISNSSTSQKSPPKPATLNQSL
ncbi:MAG: hypothetical protein OEW37_10700 [Rhodospirillaceae bacterium]|nr:hypothetical protein [Rhodospirillaceae bacterium]